MATFSQQTYRSYCTINVCTKMKENQALVAKKFETNTQNVRTRIGSQIMVLSLDLKLIIM